VIGRGAIDDKGSLMAIFEAVERSLQRGHQPRQTIYLAFGHDEERGGAGAQAMAALLKQRGANIGLGLDEGYAVLDGVIGGVNVPVAMIGIGEKGYVSVELTATGSGGHSSMPANDNSAVRIARAVDRLFEHQMPARIDGASGAMLDGIAPYGSFTMRAALANRWLTGPLVERQLLGVPSTAAAIRTTTAPTILNAGTKDNVIPQVAHAVVNHRILPGDSIASVEAHLRKALANDAIQIKPHPGNSEPSPISPTDGTGYRAIEEAVRQTFPDAIVAPGLMTAGTDSRHLGLVSDQVFRFSPFRASGEALERFHGTNERLAVSNYGEMIRFYHQLLRNTAAQPQ